MEVFYQSRSKAFKTVLISVAFVLLGYLLVVTVKLDGSLRRDIQWLVGYLGMVSGSLFAALSLIAAIIRPVGLRIEETGIRVGSLSGMKVLVRWESISYFDPLQHYIVVRLVDSDAFIKSVPNWLQKAIFRLNQAVFGYAVTIADSGLEGSRSEILGSLNRSLQQSKGNP